MTTTHAQTDVQLLTPQSQFRWLVKEHGKIGKWYEKCTYTNNATLQQLWTDQTGGKQWVDVPIVMESTEPKEPV